MKKSIFLFFAAILCSMSINAAVPSKLYLDASGWGYADARYAAYFMPQNSFVDMTKATGEVSVFEVAVPASQTKVIFVRMNGSKPANDWANKWNQTGDLTIPTDGKNKFKPSGWDGATTTWSTYTYTPPTLYIAGDFVSPNWNPAAAANKMDYADGVYSKSYNNVAAGAHQFKITNGTWDNAIGYNKNTCSGTNCEVKDNGGNIQFTPLAEGTVTITYTLADGKVHITCPEPPAAEFNITYPATQTNYTLVAGPAKAQTGAEVSFTATPAEGYVLNVTYNGNVIAGENNVYTFMMPASDVTIAITAVAATTLYYVDHNNWGNVNAYMWDNNGNNGWPGAAMTSVGTVGDKAYSYYSISFAQGAYTSIIFNNGSGSQTGDLTINTAKPYFYDGAWYTWDELLAKLAAPVVTYDYYITGSFNGNNPKKAENGMTLDGTVYKATVTLAAGDNTLKVTDGTWDKTWGANELGAAYEEVSNPNDYNNIKITLAAEKSITVIFDATTGKITFEGLTEKVVVISYVLMGVNDDWTTGIPLVRNEENTEFEEYVLLDQEILAGDSVKVVTLVDGVATAWCGRVDVQSVELLGITFAEENGNIILAPGKYDFYYKVADNGIYIAGEAYPVVEPELPAASVRAWAYDLALAVEGEQYTFSYKATTAALATLIFTDGEGVELATVELGLVEAGANSVVLAKSELPLGKKVNWAIKLEAGAIENVVEVTDQSRGIYDFYNMMDVLVDNNPESEYFGKIYIQMAYNGASDGATDRADVQTAGLFIYDQELNELNNPSNVGIKPTLPAGYTMGDNRNKFHRLEIDPKTGNLTYCYNVSGQPAIFSIDRANLTGNVTNLLEGVNGITRSVAHCFDAEGALYVYDLPSAGIIHKVVDGVATVFAPSNAKWVQSSASMAVDGMGGLWVAQNRGQIDTYYQLAHYTAEGAIDFAVYQGNENGFTGSSTRGALAYDAERQLLAQGRNGKVEVYSVAYDAETGVPTLTLVASTPYIASNIDGLHFDYAGDLYVVSSGSEKFYKYALPTANNVCTTPAASKYAFQNIEYDTMEITMTNLEVAEMDGYLVLTASDEMETGLNVMLALNEDGSVSEMSYAAISSGWMETELPIVGGNITKTYSEELATDVYSGLVVVENMGGYLGLQLTMYYVAPEYTDIVITNAIVTEDVRDLGWGDATYTVLTLESTWSDGVETYPVLVEVNDYDLSVVEGTAVVSVTIGGWGDEDPWLGNVPDGEMKYTIADGVITLTGKLDNPSAWPAPVYWNLTISGTLPKPQVPTALGNIDSSVAPVKMLKNGQLIIEKDGVQYNVNGAILK